MTPEELHRTIEFIVESQARLTAAQQLDREDRIEFEKWSKGLLAQIATDRTLALELLKVQSSRLDRSEELLNVQSSRLDRAEREDRAAQERHEQLLREIQVGFNRVMEKLIDRPS